MRGAAGLGDDRDKGGLCRMAPTHRPAMRHTFIVPPPVDLLRIHLPTSGHVRNTRPRRQRLFDDRHPLRRRPAATTGRSARNRNTPIVTLCFISVVKHSDRPKLPLPQAKQTPRSLPLKKGDRPPLTDNAPMESVFAALKV